MAYMNRIMGERKILNLISYQSSDENPDRIEWKDVK